MPTTPVQFFRYLSIEPEALKKKVWLDQLVGIFTVNVSNISNLTFVDFLTEYRKFCVVALWHYQKYEIQESAKELIFGGLNTMACNEFNHLK